MARIRAIKPEFFDDPDTADLSALARLFFIGLWTQADREGRLIDDARRLRARIFPYDPAVNIEALTVELHGKDMIRRYSDDDGKQYIWIRSFSKHQRPHPKEPTSLIPACPRGGGKINGEPCKETASRVVSGSLFLDPCTTAAVESHGSPDDVSAVIVPKAVLDLMSTEATQKPRGITYTDSFERFWKIYPKKKSKNDAWKAWQKIKPDLALVATILEAIEHQRTWPEWTKDHGQYVPNPASWLNAGRWTDEPSHGVTVTSTGEYPSMDAIRAKMKRDFDADNR